MTKAEALSRLMKNARIYKDLVDDYDRRSIAALCATDRDNFRELADSYYSRCATTVRAARIVNRISA